MSDTKRIWSKLEIIDALDRSDKFVENALIAMYERQTEEEQTNRETTCKNGIGFASSDGRWMSGLSETLIARRNYKTPFSLKTETMDKLRRALKKYSGQIAEIANKKANI